MTFTLVELDYTADAGTFVKRWAIVNDATGDVVRSWWEFDLALAEASWLTAHNYAPVAAGA